MNTEDNSNPKLPDRLCEDWRFGSPHLHATALAQLLRLGKGGGCITVTGADDALHAADSAGAALAALRSIGSDALLVLHRARPMEGAVLHLEHDYAEPITILYETEGVFTPVTRIVAAPGVRAHIIERHVCRGQGTGIFSARIITAGEGAQLSVELHEEGFSAASRAMNITAITAGQGASVRHLTTHANHAWAREETLAELTAPQADVRLFSANRLEGRQILDQHTRQLHSCGGCSSNLLYKNVLDGHAAAVFAGNIFVSPDAHDTDAYQSNRNMLLSEDAAVHSLPGLEILADRVRCSHGSASAPMDEQQLFYLLSRGIPRHQAQLLVAHGFLQDATDKFAGA